VTTRRFHLAQANIARMRAPLQDPLMAGFASQLDAINAAAGRSPGFLWRLQTGDGNATAIRAFEDELEEGKERLRILAAEGRTTKAFTTFKVWFPPPGEEAAAAQKPEFETCEWTT